MANYKVIEVYSYTHSTIPAQYERQGLSQKSNPHFHSEKNLLNTYSSIKKVQI